MGIGIYATFTVIGLGFIIQKSEAIFFIIQVCGSLFLMLLGLLFVFTKKNASESSSYQIHSNSFAQGFAIAIINPKILIFFIAIYSQFINADAELIEKTILVSTSAIIDAIWYIFVSVLVTGYGLKEFLFNNRHVIQKIIGALLIFIALSLLYNLTNN
jgi:threonine/homoserine/homoserine lactone efflux protein